MPIAIAGMHRSGTSMVAKMLRDGGLYLGTDDELMQAASDNTEGFWEHIDIVMLNDAILGEMGGAWDLPPQPPANWEDNRFAPMRDLAGKFVGRFSGHEPWGWKDPRNSLTLPLWRTVLGEFQVVSVVRNPLEVAMSLSKRNNFSPALGLYLWYAYNKRVLDETKRDQRLITHFDAYFGDAAPEIARLLRFAGLPHGAAEVARLTGNAMSGMKHHRIGAAELAANGVAAEIIDLYAELCEEAEFDHELGSGDVSRRRVPLSASSPFTQSGLPTGVSKVDLWFYTQHDRFLELDAEMRIYEATRLELEGRLAERDGMILEREGRIGDRDNRLAERDRTIARLTQDLSSVRETIADQVALIDAQAVRIATLERHEQELRRMLSSVHNQLLNKDIEVMGTLGAVLSRTAPGAPAAIYYRQLLQQVRDRTLANVPAGAKILVASYGDPAMLDLPNLQTTDFPRTPAGVAADYTTVDSTDAILQLEELRDSGAMYLVLPSPAQSWLTRHPTLERHIREHYPTVVDELGVCTIFALQHVSAA